MNGADSVAITPTLRWKKVAGAKGYQLEVSNKDNFVGGQTDDFRASDTTLKLVNLKTKTTYYWRFAVGSANFDRSGNASQQWSLTWMFKT